MAKTKTKKTKEKKENYFKGVKKEMALVKWPSGKEVFKNTVATIILCVVVSLFFILLNLGLAAIKGWFV